jgi:dTDP-4-dehydrorhamnose 3,5-epimerase-like enzyme
MKLKRIDIDSHAKSDPRGWSINLLAASGVPEDCLGNLHTASLNPGSVRGNHYHEESTEWLLVFGGPSKVSYREVGGETIEMEVIEDPRPVLFEIPPNTEHAVLNASNVNVYIMVFRNTREADTRPCSSLFE